VAENGLKLAEDPLTIHEVRAPSNLNTTIGKHLDGFGGFIDITLVGDGDLVIKSSTMFDTSINLTASIGTSNDNLIISFFVEFLDFGNIKLGQSLGNQSDCRDIHERRLDLIIDSVAIVVYR